MIDFHTWATPNGTKVALMLEECRLPYRVISVNLGRGEQNAMEFLRINPNGKIPAIVDHDGPDGRPLVLFESGAILIYLAEKTGLLLPQSGHARFLAIQWTIFQMSAVGPMFGQLHHFKSSTAQRHGYGRRRFEQESRRLLAVLDCHLSNHDYLAGDKYGVADICTWPWLRSWQTTIGDDLEGFECVARWYRTVEARAAAVTAVALYESLKRSAANGPVNAGMPVEADRR
jgi:GSH-dependent disulfide-bond oxidoreductase